MTRIFTEGAEMQDITFLTDNTNYVVSNSDPSPLYSDYYFTGAQTRTVFSPPVPEFYFRYRIYYTDWYNGNGNFCLPSFGQNGGYGMSISPTGGGYLYFRRQNSTILATSTNPLLENNKWYLFEVYYLVHDTTGRLVLYVDGISALDFTGNTSYGMTNVDTLTFNGVTTCLDDMALNDTNGSEDNSWCGDGVIKLISPSGSGTVNSWLNSGSVSGSSNYLYVDDYPYDSDSTYIYSSASEVGAKDQYVMSNLYLPEGVDITHVWAEARAKKTSSEGGTTIQLGLMASGYSASTSGSIPLFTGAYTRTIGKYYRNNPWTSASWSGADIDLLEGVIEI